MSTLLVEIPTGEWGPEEGRTGSPEGYRPPVPTFLDPTFGDTCTDLRREGEGVGS